MPTIYDIAKKAGVSPTTVSKVFNNYSDVSEKTKKKVQEVAKEMGYVPNLTARSLKTNRSYLVGVVFSENVGIGLEHQFFSVVLENFRKVIGEYGYDTIFINNTLGDQKIGYLDHCKYRNVDGVFIITAQEDDVDVSKLLDSNIKCVTTDIKLANTPFIMSDNLEGSMLAMTHLYEEGHRKIAHIAGPQNSISGEERFDGYKAALAHLGLSYRDDYFVEADMFKYDQAYEATMTLLNRFEKDDMPTAIYVGADIMAIAAINAIGAYGLRVPEDISIIGFDDIQLAKYASPGLTTIRQNKDLIGETVAKTLYNLINDEDVPVEVPRLPVDLVRRASVKQIRAE